MLATLIRKELKAILVSPKFTATFAVCSVLILVSVYTGIAEYRSSVKQYEAAIDLNEQRLQEQTSWGHVADKAFRRPDPLQIFAAGLTFDIGRWSIIADRLNVKLMGSTYSQDPIFALFRFVDFTFIVLFVLTLLAILFTYDTISGEKEGGTMRLVFSNAVPRAQYLIAKAVGAWLGLVMSILIPTLMAVLLVMVCRVPMLPGDWVRVTSLLALALALFTFFIFFGVMISTLTRRSSVSFLVCLVCWVGFVMIIPRAGVMAAGSIIEVPRMAEIEGQRDAFAGDRWKQFYENARERWQATDADPGQMTDEEWEKVLWNRMQEEDSLRQLMEQEIEDHERRLLDDLERRKIEQQKLAFALSRISPASAFQLGAISIAGTDMNLKSRYSEAFTDFPEAFLAFTKKKQEETGLTDRIHVSSTSDGKFNIDLPRESSGLDLTGLPRLTPPVITVTEAVTPAVVDFGLIVLASLFSFVVAFVAFGKYDLR